VVERLELGEDIFPNLRLSVYPGGHMFYMRADARKQFFDDAKALYETPSRNPQP
jgi:carboxypeptidase C (cathepsin A)